MLTQCAQALLLVVKKELAPLGVIAFGDREGRQYNEYLLPGRTFTIPVFYGIIKVHKRTPALRPITACHSWVTTPLAQIAAWQAVMGLKSCDRDVESARARDPGSQHEHVL